MTHEVLQPAGWARPKGYANGIAAHGRTVFIAGQIGWDAQGRFVEKTLSGQVRQALENILSVLAVAGGDARHIGRMTWYVTDMEAYRSGAAEIGAAYRGVMGRHFPAMTLVEQAGLFAPVNPDTLALVPKEKRDLIPEMVDSVRSREGQLLDYVRSSEFTLAGLRKHLVVE